MAVFNEPAAFAVKHKNQEVRDESRSGGMFTALTDPILDAGGVVYGCILDKTYMPVHARAVTKTERNAMRGSKYAESNLGNIYCCVKADLESGKQVLFSGTSCQVAGLKLFLGKNFDNLLLVDVICHGVPSRKVWKKYLNWQENKYGKCLEAEFRNKKDFGWADHIETMRFNKNGNEQIIHSRIYTTIFYRDIALRPSCYECKFKKIIRPGDITLADYWEIDRTYPEFNDNKGISLVMVNNDRGMSFFEKAKPDLQWKKVDFAISTRYGFFHSPFKPGNRQKFWEDLENKDFSFVAKKYGMKPFYSRLKGKIKKLVNAVGG